MKDIIIKVSTTIKEAMEALNKTTYKVLLVVDENQELLGTLSDGDIRRCILKGQSLISTIEDAYNRNPISVLQEDFDKEKTKEILIKNKINLIPILDSKHRMVDFVTWEKLFGDNRLLANKKLDVDVVIMAGGGGARLDPFTRVLPKSLIPIGEKPVIVHIIDRFRKYGISNFYITVHHKAKILRAYFEEKAMDYRIEFAEEEQPRGTAGGLRLLLDKLKRPFFVSNCDIIIEGNYGDIYRFHQKNRYDITLVASAKQFSIPYGVCELNGNGTLKRINEKPEYNFLVNTGLYILNPNIIELIPDKESFHITHLLEKIRVNNGAIGVYPVSEKAWIDVGQWAEYRKALKAIDGI